MWVPVAVTMRALLGGAERGQGVEGMQEGVEEGQADSLTHLCPLCFGRTGSQRHCLLFPSLERSQDKKAYV